MAILRIGHSPDADDAFMFFGFAQGAIDTGPYEVEHVVEDIESLNRRAADGELEMTAISAAAYPLVSHHYRILACGASIGRNYGPIVVANSPMDYSALNGKRIAIPGDLTTAYMMLRMYVPDLVPEIIPFDQIMDAVAQGKVDAGVLIHEGQITYSTHGFCKVLDLGEAWFRDTNLPIPLGLDVVNRALGETEAKRLYDIFLASVRYARAHEDEANAYAQTYSRGLDLDLSSRFVNMYVNEDTMHMGNEGYRALQVMYQRAYEHGLIKLVPPLDIVGLQ